MFESVVLAVCLCMFVGTLVFAADTADTIYNKQGQAVQIFAPNYFQTLTAVQTTIDLTNTMAFECDTTAACKVYLSPSNSKTAITPMRLQADIPRVLGRGHRIGFAIYSGCTGTYSAMKGDWAGQ